MLDHWNQRNITRICSSFNTNCSLLLISLRRYVVSTLHYFLLRTIQVTQAARCTIRLLISHLRSWACVAVYKWTQNMVISLARSRFCISTWPTFDIALDYDLFCSRSFDTHKMFISPFLTFDKCLFHLCMIFNKTCPRYVTNSFDTVHSIAWDP
jgi:hypothetical protein